MTIAMMCSKMRPDECCDKTVAMMNSNLDAVGRDVSMRHTDTITPEASKRRYCPMVSVDT
jgi:hypothetical protein